ncbi:phosphotransferase family protein [Maliponia aquimaris]|uniref:Phosphotransferase enzyme family protein n=1 Tax=Maliponia aquimaris TaxID=1673631 RepID=A0A238K2M5_9RHOB|nr:phosphotransferase [Maliponia aquimaris]SMX36206.1 Phosphotransferase enzyme family protein [Maliponia aquimaris]
MRLTPDAALRIAGDALARHGGGTGLRLLRAGEGPAQAHLFTAQTAAGPVLLKLWPESAAERAARQARRQRQVARSLRDGPYRVPGVTFFDAEARVLAMPLVTGQDLAALWSDSDTRAPQAAGGWLAAYHGLTRRTCAFDPTGQVNWLARLVAAGESGARTIPDLPGFTAAARRVTALAQAATGHATVRAVTHRDMTLSNLILDTDGTVWGIDLENSREDEPLRDLFTLALDLRTQGPGDGEQAATQLSQAYGDTGTDPQVRLALQGCFCLWVWANTPLTPSIRQTRRLEVAEALLRRDTPAI